MVNEIEQIYEIYLQYLQIYFVKFRYEMGVYDQPAIIDYILAKTNTSKLYYIGYSQGTTSLLVMLSERPEYNDKIYAASLMAPVGYIYGADSIYKLFTVAIPILRVISSKQKYSSKELEMLKWIVNIILAIGT